MSESPPPMDDVDMGEEQEDTGAAAAATTTTSKDDADLFGGAEEDSMFEPIVAEAPKPKKQPEPEPEPEEEQEEVAAPPPKKETPKAAEPPKAVETPKPQPAPVQATPVAKPQPKAAPAAAASSSDFDEEPVVTTKKKVPALAADGHSFTIVVTDPEKVGDGINSYMAYKVIAKTTLPSYKQAEMSVQRRFSDFFTLRALLIQKYAGVIVPPCPPKDAVGTGMMKFKGQGNEMTPFILQRRAGLQRFMQRIVDHPALRDDEFVHMFLETDQKLPKPKGDILAMLSKVLGSYFERDEWFEEKMREIDALDSMLKKLHTALENTVAARRDLSQSTTKFAESFAALAEAEEVDELKMAMHKLADVEAKVAKLQQKQGDRDFYDFSEIVADYLGLVGAIRTCFQQRVQAFKTFQSAESNLQKKRENDAKVKALNKAEKFAQSEQEVKEAEEQVAVTKKAFEDVSKRIKVELERFNLIQIKELQDVVVSYIEAVMTLQHQTVKAWEAFLPDAKAINMKS